MLVQQYRVQYGGEFYLIVCFNMFHVSILVSHNIFLNVRHKSCWSHNKTLWTKLQISFQFLLQNGDWVLIYFTLTGAVVRLMAGYLMVLWCVGAVQSCRNHWVVFYRQTPGTDWTAVHYRDTFIRYTPRYATARWGAAGPARRENMSFTLLLCCSATLGHSECVRDTVTVVQQWSSLGDAG